MDYMDHDVRCPKKAVKINHSTPVEVMSWMSSYIPQKIMVVISYSSHNPS